MNRRTEEAILHENGSLLSVQPGTGELPVNASVGGESAPAEAAASAEVAAPVAAEPVAAVTAP
jgi:hypothetical protein